MLNPGGESSESGSGNEAVDYGQILQQHETAANEHATAIAEQGKTVDQLRRQLGESQQVIGRVRQAFTGEQDRQPAPHERAISKHQEILDYYLQQGIEAERQGKPMPLTISNGVQLAQFAIEQTTLNNELKQELAAVKQAIARQENPDYQLTDRAAAAMEGMLEEGLAQVYGTDPAYDRTRQSQFTAVANRITEEIKDLMKNEPATWNQIRRQPTAMRRMVNHFVHEMLPPRAREIMEQQRIQATPQPVEELYQAFHEAREQMMSAKNAETQQQFSDLMTTIRQQIFATQGEARRAPQGRPSLQQLFGSARRAG